jgi:CBS domain-containing protein
MSNHPESAQPTVREYMHENVLTIPVDATLKEVGQSLLDNQVSTLLVTAGNEYVGIISDKRLAREGLAKGLSPETTTVGAIMRPKLLTIESDQPVREAQEMMKANGVRHLVVTERGKIIGIVSISDLIRFYTDFFDK